MYGILWAVIMSTMFLRRWGLPFQTVPTGLEVVDANIGVLLLLWIPVFM